MTAYSKLKPTELSKTRYEWHVVNGSIYLKQKIISGNTDFRFVNSNPITLN